MLLLARLSLSLAILSTEAMKMAMSQPDQV
jgi:hypothetical protein